ncbi:MAG: GGDEF domain-containing protein [Desulfobulbaceae bacterium]|nr:GGDEF domain-containing protein [Desulfobulbaceae bacterium]
MSTKKNSVLIGSKDIACNPICARIKDMGLPHDSLWIALSHFVKNLNNEKCFETRQKISIKESFVEYLKLVSTLENTEKIEHLGLDFMREVDNLRKSKSLQVVREEREFTSELLAAIGKNLDRLYRIVNVSNGHGMVDSVKVKMVQAITSAKGRKEILKIVEKGFNRISEEAEKTQQEIRESINSMLVLESHALIDNLTGIFNRRFYDQELPKVVQTFLDKEGSVAFSLLIMDIDNFKTINDSYGHFTGDVVLQRIAEIIQKNCRAGIDSPIRLGGDEFALFLVGSTEKNAFQKAQNIWKEISSQEFHRRDSKGESHQEVFHVTISVGICELDYKWKDVPTELLHKGAVYCDPKNDNSLYKLTCKVSEAADAALYRSKEAGRNQIQVYKFEEDEALKH